MPFKDGTCDAGLLIHEGQLFYESMGLHKVLDLGEWWHDRHGLPLPMGGNAIRRDLGPDLIKEVSELLRKSINYSLSQSRRCASVRDAVRPGYGTRTRGSVCGECG